MTEQSAEEIELCSGERMIDDLHARYHDMPGNLYGKDDCPWARCEFWDAAHFTIDVLRSAGLLLEGAETGTDYGVQLTNPQNGDVTMWTMTELTSKDSAESSSYDHGRGGYGVVDMKRSVWFGPWLPVEETETK